MTVPAVAVRALLAGTSLALLVALVAPAPEGRATWPSALAGAALVTWVAVSPASPAPTVLLLLALVVVLDAGPVPWPLLAIQAALLSAVHVLASLTALAPPGTSWEAAALVPPFRRWALVQVACLPVVLTAGLAPRDAGGRGLGVVAGALALLLVAGLALLVRRRG